MSDSKEALDDTALVLGFKYLEVLEPGTRMTYTLGITIPFCGHFLFTIRVSFP